MRNEIYSKDKNIRPASSSRAKITLAVIILIFFLVESRLFYWQIIKRQALEAEATSQYERLKINTGKRGLIYTSDGYLLVGNQKLYRLFIEPPLLQEKPPVILNQIFETILPLNPDYLEASESATKQLIETNLRQSLLSKLSLTDKKWVGLINGITETAKEKLSSFDISGLGFEPYFERYYPEASMAAHLTGFVGKNAENQPTGYFGVEGSLNQELSAEVQKELVSLFSDPNEASKINGRDITLTIRRDIQFLLETELKKGVEKYRAKSGEVIVMEPQTGKILGLAAYPSYDQKNFYQFDPELYKNPAVSYFYEPGSTFKVLTVAIGIESGAITPDTICDNCAAPRTIGKYTIRTWNDVYNPNISMTEALAKSDNIAMIFAEEKIGSQKFIDYIRRFGLGQKVTTDLQEDSSPAFPDKWGPVELATRSFGQGISATSLQMLRAINAIANHGLILQPQIIARVSNQETGEEIASSPVPLTQIISPETAQKVTAMMIESAHHGEAQWIASQDYLVAGKTGTSQVVRPEGGYDPDKTIASFVGFAPADQPRFIMITKLNEPATSPWAAETAAPLWYKIADQLILMVE